MSLYITLSKTKHERKKRKNRKKEKTNNYDFHFQSNYGRIFMLLVAIYTEWVRTANRAVTLSIFQVTTAPSASRYIIIR